jgi:hypothetical protein
MDKRGNQAINCDVGDCMFNERKAFCELTGITVTCPAGGTKTVCKSYVKK